MENGREIINVSFAFAVIGKSGKLLRWGRLVELGIILRKRLILAISAEQERQAERWMDDDNIAVPRPSITIPRYLI
jgi:hypothetical protein